MKRLIVIAFAISLVATAAFATPEDALQPKVKIDEPVKASAPSDVNLGNLDCSNVINISASPFPGNSYFGDNTDAPNNVTTWSCSEWDESGGEVVYFLSLVDQGLDLSIVTDTPGCDLDLVALFDCEVGEDDCLFVTDSGITADQGTTLDVYIVVDGYAGSGCPFELIVTDGTIPPPPAVDFCGVVDNIVGTEFTGTTCGGENQISNLGCQVFFENGLEYYYEVFMPAGASFTADYTNTADGALWVVDGCFAPDGENVTCLAYADNNDTFGGPETISYTNDSASDMFVYLVLDSWGTGSCGDFEMSFSASGGAVAVEGAAFGAVKALYR